MSVQVSDLTKIYGTQKAVNKVSFEAKKGEILGFLGPNGAGKTTTMKVITCFLPQSEGKVKVCGFDVEENPMEVRERIGYLPEHNPLYLNMYVKEYLRFIAKLHKVEGNVSKQVAKMIELTGLEREQRKQIGQLSKGYRQRVGLAQAMIHDPEVLILDEPTSGLDPNQLVEIREVIKNLGKEKTVILSSHIMQEVQAMCNRVVIIDKGEIVANDTPESLQSSSSEQTTITLEFAEKIKQSQLQQLPHIHQITPLNNHQWEIITNNNQDIRADIFRFAVQNDLTLLTLNKVTSSLEDIFRQLTN